MSEGIRIEGLRAGYGRRAVLQDVSLEVAPGTTTVLLGGNGEGKSTLLRVCLGVLRPREGVVRVAGWDPVRDHAELLQRVGYVPDFPDVPRWMDAHALFRFVGAHLTGWRTERAVETAERLGATLDTPFASMSRGQQMKVMLAAALGHDPSVLLLDEPFGGLDPVVREEVLRSVVGAMGTERAVLMATHDLEVAVRAADRVALLAAGRIVREGRADAMARGVGGSSAAVGLREALAKTERQPA